MNKLLVVMLVGLSLLTGCGEKVYSADAVYKEYQAEGEKSAQFKEVKAVCAKDRDGGEPFSKTCKVLSIVEGHIMQAETKAYMEKKYGK